MAEESDIYGDSLPQARDFKLDPLLNFALQDLNAIVAVSAPLRNVQRAFGDNIHRLQSTIILPVFNVRFACSLERCVAIAEHEQNGFINIEIATEPMPQRLSIPQAAIGEPILLDGEIVVNLVVGAFKAANDLLAGVEEWLTKN